MEKFKEILYDIWREACRHIEITESLPVISGILVQHLPLAQVQIQMINPAAHTVSTAAFGFDKGPRPCDTKKLKKVQTDILQQWHNSGAVLDRLSGAADPDITLLSCDPERDFLIAPLRGQKDLLPVIHLAAREGINFSNRHRAMLERILEPLSTAVENDARLRELVSLREAAEADKNSFAEKAEPEKYG